MQQKRVDFQICKTLSDLTELHTVETLNTQLFERIIVNNIGNGLDSDHCHDTFDINQVFFADLFNCEV